MSNFIKYQHIERWGQEEVEGIDLGECYIFPKLDGTNASIWIEDGTLKAGSRNRTLSLDKDNAGFYYWVLSNEPLYREILEANPTWHLFGEWLVPHTLKTYRIDAWKRFWIFDVYCREREIYLPYMEYAPYLGNVGLDPIPPLCIVKDGTEDTFKKAMYQNTFLIKDGEGVGEGIVVKNYPWRNKYGRQTWAKLVRNEFKERNREEFGIQVLKGESQIEADIAEIYVTAAFVQKTRAKIELETKDRKVLIPRLLQTCYHDLVKEELWHIVKSKRNPVIDFSKLHRHVVYRVKQHAQDLF